MKLRSVILLMFALLLAPVAQAQSESGDVKKIAILEVVDKDDAVKVGVKKMISDYVTKALINTPGCMAKMCEDVFPHIGNLSEEQIKVIDKLVDADFILIPEVARVDDRSLLFSATLLDVETAQIVVKTNLISPTDIGSIEKNCRELALKLSSALK